MNWKLFVLALVLLRAVWDFVLNRVQLRSANNPTPENLKDVYDEKTYDNWKRYSADKCRLNFVSTAVTVAVTVSVSSISEALSHRSEYSNLV